MLDVAVIRLPHLANFTDFDPLTFEAGVRLRYVTHAGGLGDPDLVILPGSKATVADLAWLRERGLDGAIAVAMRRDCALLGICAGYQMLCTSIDDEVESRAGKVPGLGLLEAVTIFQKEKRTRQRSGLDASGETVFGYEIHHGQPTAASRHTSWFVLEDGEGREHEGVAESSIGIWATSLHGIFESDGLRHTFLSAIASRRKKCFVPAGTSFESRRQAEIDQIADCLEAHLELEATFAIIAEGAPR